MNGEKRLAKPREINDSEGEPDELDTSGAGLMDQLSKKRNPNITPSSSKAVWEEEQPRSPQEGIAATECDVIAMFSNSKVLMDPGEDWVACQSQLTGTVRFYDVKTHLAVFGMTIQPRNI